MFAIEPKDSDGDLPGYVGSMKRLPLVADNMNQEWGAIENPEISKSESHETVDLELGLWRGTFRTLMYYNSSWFHWLMCQLMGGSELFIQDVRIDGGSYAATLANAHIYMPQSFHETADGSAGAIPYGLSLRAYKVGPTNPGSGTFGQRVRRLQVVGATFEWPESGWPTVTWEVIGSIAETLALGAPLTVVNQGANEYPVKPGDIGIEPTRTVVPSVSKGGIVSGDRNISSARLTIRNNINFVPRWGNDFIDTAPQVREIGHDAKFSVEVSLTSLLEQSELNAAQAGSVYPTWVSGIFNTGFYRLRAVSARQGVAHSSQSPLVDAANDVPYGMDVYLPLASLRGPVSAPIEREGLLQLTWNYRGFIGPVPTAGTALSAGYDVPIMFQFQVANTDDADAKYSAATQGGNDPNTELLT